MKKIVYILPLLFMAVFLNSSVASAELATLTETQKTGCITFINDFLTRNIDIYDSGGQFAPTCCSAYLIYYSNTGSMNILFYPSNAYYVHDGSYLTINYTIESYPEHNPSCTVFTINTGSSFTGTYKGYNTGNGKNVWDGFVATGGANRFPSGVTSSEVFTISIPLYSSDLSESIVYSNCNLKDKDGNNFFQKSPLVHRWTNPLMGMVKEVIPIRETVKLTVPSLILLLSWMVSAISLKKLLESVLPSSKE